MSEEVGIDYIINCYVGDSEQIEEKPELHKYFIHESNDGFEYLHKLLDDKKHDFRIEQKIQQCKEFLMLHGYIISERPIENEFKTEQLLKENDENEHSI